MPAPNDSMFNLCYWLQQTSRRDLHALEAWEITRGDPSAVIAIIDTGLLPYHPDLGGVTSGSPGQLWNNAAEKNGIPGLDDDGNGYVDDVWGWDFVALDSAAMARPGEDWRDEDNDPTDFAGHGTGVAGVAGAISGNVSGIAGVAPGARLMALRVGYSTPQLPVGEVDLSWAASAIVYAARNGAAVINCSFSSVLQPDLADAITAAIRAGVTIVVASGNNGSDHYMGSRSEVLSVAASDQGDHITLFSNRGEWVDLAAPGQSIATTTLRPTGTDSIGLRSPWYSPSEAGTSFSSPMVAGAVALLQSDRHQRGLAPLLPPQVLLRLTETTDNITTLNPGTGYGSGRLNLQRMLSDPPLSAAFPAAAPSVGSAAVLPMQSGQSLAVYATADSGLLFMRAASGDTVARVALGSRPVGGVAAADLGGALGNGVFVALADGRIAGFDIGGAALPGWPVNASTTRGEDPVMPALGDLDGDGRVEIVWGGDDGNVWAWKSDGTRVPGFPRPAGIAGKNLRLALGQLDTAPGLEIVAGANNFALYAFHGDGTPLTGWPVIVGDQPAAPVIMRLGSNPTPTVVVASAANLRAFLPDGSVKFFRSFVPPGFIAQDLAVGDLGGDGRDEIVAITEGPNQMFALDSTGAQVATRSLATHPTGPPLIGPLASGGGTQVVVPAPDNQNRTRLLAYTPALADLARWPKAGYPGSEPSMADVDGDGATELAAGVGSDGLFYLYDAGPGTWRAAAARWPTARGNFARTGSRLDIPPLVPGDDLAPAGIADLEGADPTTREVRLRWTAPTDPGPSPRVTAYDARVSDQPINEDNFARATAVTPSPAPATPGAPESLLVSGLRESSTHWIAIRSRDARGNWSPLSNPLSIQTRTREPAKVADLRVASGGDSTLTLVWTASGDDANLGRPAYYRIRLSEAPLDSAAFEAATLGEDVPATAEAGQAERATLRHLPRGHRLWVGLRAVDAAGNVSAISNSVAPLIGRLAPFSGLAMLPTRSPSRLPVEIEWQGAPGWSGSRQKIELFDLGGRLQAWWDLPALPNGIVVWNGHTHDGFEAPAGVYFARLTSGPFQTRGRIVLLR